MLDSSRMLEVNGRLLGHVLEGRGEARGGMRHPAPGPLEGRMVLTVTQISAFETGSWPLPSSRKPHLHPKCGYMGLSFPETTGITSWPLFLGDADKNLGD